MSQSKWVRVGSVRRFDEVKAIREQVVKMAEEVMEVFSAWEDIDRIGLVHGAFSLREVEDKILAECADVIQATLNLVAALDVEDFRPWMKECEERNRRRGRITDGWSK